MYAYTMKHCRNNYFCYSIAKDRHHLPRAGRAPCVWENHSHQSTVLIKKLPKPTSRKQQGLQEAFRDSGCSDTTPILGVGLHTRPVFCRASQRATPAGQPGGSGTLLKDRKTHQLKIVCSRLCEVRSVYLSRLSDKMVIVLDGVKLLVKPKHT